jgi:hypothetical protein
MANYIYLLLLMSLSLAGCGKDEGSPTNAAVADDDPSASIGEIPNVPTTPDPVGTKGFSLVRFRDTETGTLWNLRGEAIDGELAGQQLEQVPAYSAYWFAWASFWQNTAVWSAAGVSDNGRLESDSFAALPNSEFQPDLPRDAISPIDDPGANFSVAEFVNAAQAEYFMDEDIVVGVVINGDARAYPVKILNFHEIVNHQVGGRQVAVTYCPLTASGIHFATEEIAFGNTGGLYNNNMVMYDRRTESFWSQMRLSAIIGTHATERLDLLPVFQGTWQAWRTLYPNTGVLTENTGYNRNYRQDIYIVSNYTTSTDVWFRQTPQIDTRFHPKEMVVGLVGTETVIAYPFTNMGDATVINDSFEETRIAVVFQRSAQAAFVFNREVAGQLLSFELVE